MISSFVLGEGASSAAKLEALLERQRISSNSAERVEVAPLRETKNRLAGLRPDSCVAAKLDSLSHIAAALVAACDASACSEPAWLDFIGELIVVCAFSLRTEYSALTSHLLHPDLGMDSDERVAVVHAVAALAVHILRAVLLFPHVGDTLLAQCIALAAVVASWQDSFSLQSQVIFVPTPTEDLHLITSGLGGFRKLETWVLPTPLQTLYCYPCLRDHFCSALSPAALDQLSLCIALLLDHLRTLVNRSHAAELQTLCLVQLAKWWGSDSTSAATTMPFAQAAMLVLKQCQTPVQANTWASMLALCQALLDGTCMPGQLCGLTLLRDLASQSTSTTLLQVLPTLAPQLLVVQRVNTNAWPQLLSARLLQTLAVASPQDCYCILLAKELLSRFCEDVSGEFNAQRAWIQATSVQNLLDLCQAYPVVLCGHAQDLCDSFLHLLNLQHLPVQLLALRSLLLLHRCLPASFAARRLEIATEVLRVHVFYRSLAGKVSAEYYPSSDSLDALQAEVALCWTEMECAQALCASLVDVSPELRKKTLDLFPAPGEAHHQN